MAPGRGGPDESEMSAREPLLRLTGLHKDLGGGLSVRRLLPSLPMRSIGPFVFLDHFGPVTVYPSSRMDVRPHPHIGLATVSYLFEGSLMHRDSLGSEQQIVPGDINWMTAGSGIVHSERRPASHACKTYVNHGLQLWAALPRHLEQMEPRFAHTPAADMPCWRDGGALARLLVGSGWGLRSPVATVSDTLLIDLELEAGARLELPALAQEMAVYTVNAPVLLNRTSIAEHTLVPLPGDELPCTLKAGAESARVMVLGGAALDGKRHLWWNFVASDKSLIERAAQRWEDNAFGKVPGDDERIPLPGHYIRR